MTDGLEKRLRGEAERDGVTKMVVGAIAHRNGDVLILRRSQYDDFLPGIEELPSGGVESGETLMNALARELTEEIGWSGSIMADPDFVTSFDYVSGSGRKTRQYTFSVAAGDRAVTLSGEHTEYRWIAPAHVADCDVTDETAQAVYDWMVRFGGSGR